MDVDAEVALLHAELARWLGSAAPDAVFDSFAAAQHPQFSMVTTEGEIVDRAALLDGLAAARNAQPGLVIMVSQIEEPVGTESMVMVRFLETHQLGDIESRRRVTAVLLPDPGARHGLSWLRVHETAVSNQPTPG